jgi:maleate isomerase
MYGWKARIGLILPSRNTTMEPEFQRIVPEGVSVHATRVNVEQVSPQALARMEKALAGAARLLVAVNPDIIIFGCTSGSLIKGPGYDRRLSDKITRITGVQALTTSTAVVEALKILKIRKAAVATPYTEEVNRKEKEFLEGYGIQVVRIKGMGCSKPARSYPLAANPVSLMGLWDPSLAYKLALDVHTPQAEGIFISCTNLRTLEIIDPLEKNSGKPVVTSNQASMAIALRRLGIRERISGFGRLLENPDL